MKILLVEDTGYTREIIKKGLISDGISSRQEIIEAYNGLEGVKLYKEHLPDIVVMDINMPEVNGYDACMQILDVNPNAQVIFVSNDKSPDAPDKAIRVGGIKFFSKPVQIAKINSFIKSLTINPPVIKESSDDEDEIFFLDESTLPFELKTNEELDLSIDDDFGQPIITSNDFDFFECETHPPTESVHSHSLHPSSLDNDTNTCNTSLKSTSIELNEYIDFEDAFFADLGPNNIDKKLILLDATHEVKEPVAHENISKLDNPSHPDAEENLVEEDFFGDDIMLDEVNSSSSLENLDVTQKEDDFFFDAEDDIPLSNSNVNEESVFFESSQTDATQVDEDTEFLSAEDEEFCFEPEHTEAINSHPFKSESDENNGLETEITDLEEDAFDLGEDAFDLGEDAFDLGEDAFDSEQDTSSDVTVHTSSEEPSSAFHNSSQRKQTIIKRVPLSESKKEELSKSEHHVVYEKDLNHAKSVNIKPPRTNLLASDTQLPLEEPIMNPSNDIIIDNTQKTSSKQGIFDKVKSIFLGKKD